MWSRLPEMPSSKYTKELCDIKRHLFTNGRKSFVKQQQAELSPNGRTEKQKYRVEPANEHAKTQKLLVWWENVNMVIAS